MYITDTDISIIMQARKTLFFMNVFHGWNGHTMKILICRWVHMTALKSATIVQNATLRDFYSTHAPILFYFPCSYLSKIVSRKFLLPHIESKSMNPWSSPSAIFVSFSNVWPLISWFHWNKSEKLSMCRSFSCSSFTISFVKKQIVWKLISQKLIVKIE